MAGKPSYKELEQRVKELEQDVRVLKRAEGDLRETRDYLENLFNYANAPIIVWNPESRIVRFNHAFEHLTGYKDEEVIGRKLSMLFPEVSLNESLNKIQHTLSGEYWESVEIPILCKNGDIRVALWNSANIYAEDGTTLLSTIAQGTDISLRKQAEEALRESEKRLRTITDTALDSIFCKDINRRYTFVNPSMIQLMDCTKADLIGKVPEEVFDKGDASIVTEVDERTLNGENISEVRSPSIAGKPYTFHTIQVPLHDSDGNITGISGIVRDITELVQAEEALRKSETLLSATQQLAKVGGWEWDVKSETMFWTEETYRIHDFQRDEFKPGSSDHIELGLKCYDPEDRPIIMGAFRRCIEKGEAYDLEFPFTTAMGHRKWIRTATEPVLEGDRIVKVVGNIMDITVSKQAEEALRESEEKYRSMMEAMNDPVYICSPDFRVEYMNPAMIRRTGHDATGEHCFKALHDLKEKCSWCMHYKAQQGEYLEQNIVSPKDDRSYHVSHSPIVHETGSISKMTVFRDITDLKTLEAQFRQAQKMEAVGRLAGGVAHDFNNLLMTIIGYADLMLMGLAEDNPFREKLEQIKGGGERAASLTRQLLAFSRKQILQPVVLDLNSLITDFVKMLKRLIGEDVELETVLAPELRRVEADPGQMEQVIMNLVINARDAMPDGGGLIIETVNADLDEDYTKEHDVSLQPGPYVMLGVSDTGMGMDAETQSLIFEPFFTTKEEGKGTGLGLATVYGIVKQSGGYIWIYSEPGQGTTFKIYLPAVEGEPVQVQKEQTSADLTGSETILIVEDDDALRNLGREILEPQGYTILEAENGIEALRVSEEHDGQIHLMITDVVMPKMGGRELEESLRPLHPEMKVVYMSGYTDNAILHHGVLSPEIEFLQKPITSARLKRKVRDVLDS